MKIFIAFAALGSLALICTGCGHSSEPADTPKDTTSVKKSEPDATKPGTPPDQGSPAPGGAGGAPKGVGISPSNTKGSTAPGK